MNGESTPQQKMFLLPRHAPVLKHLSIIRAKGAQAFINHQSEDEIIAQSILMSPEAYSDVTGGDAWFQLSCHSASF